jgi:glycosyltransferase involved in cell wall biosynthesis
MWASVVIITKNQRAFLERSLPMLAAQAVPPGAAFEVIVVDSGSTDGAQTVVRAHAPLARLIEIAPASFGYARAHNLGAAHARGAFLARLSGDAIPQRPDWLRCLLAPFDDPAVAATWGRQILPSGLRSPLERLAQRLFYDARRPARTYPRPTLVFGSCMAVRASLWRAHPYDERIPQAEDFAWLVHWQRRGYVGAYVPEATVLHGHDEPLGRALRRAFAQSTLHLLIRAGVWGR